MVPRRSAACRRRGALLRRRRYWSRHRRSISRCDEWARRWFVRAPADAHWTWPRYDEGKHKQDVWYAHLSDQSFRGRSAVSDCLLASLAFLVLISGQLSLVPRAGGLAERWQLYHGLWLICVLKLRSPLSYRL